RSRAPTSSTPARSWTGTDASWRTAAASSTWSGRARTSPPPARPRTRPSPRSPSAAATTAPTSPPYDHRRPYDSALAPAQATSATTHRPGPPRSRPKAGSEPARNLIAQRAAGRDEAMRRSRALLAVGGPPGPKENEERRMIERYTLPEMGRVWSDAHKYELWCRVEVLVCEAHAKAGTIPAEVVEPVRNAPPPTPEAVHEIEAVTQHDVIAFLTAWANNTEPREAARYVHFGMTSSDLLDTALALQLVEATDILLAKADALVATLRDHALEHRATLRVGRTHGIHGEPDVWGHRVADFAFAMARSRDRLRRARE